MTADSGVGASQGGIREGFAIGTMYCLGENIKKDWNHQYVDGGIGNAYLGRGRS